MSPGERFEKAYPMIQYVGDVLWKLEREHIAEPYAAPDWILPETPYNNRPPYLTAPEWLYDFWCGLFRVYYFHHPE